MLRCTIVLCILVLQAAGSAYAAANDWHSAADFIWEKLGHERFPELIRRHGNLAGTANPRIDGSAQTHGMLKYRFETSAAGWHVLEYDGFPAAARNPEAAFDDDANDGPFLVFQGPGDRLAARVWLSRGPHVLTLKRNFYHGIPGITRWRVRPADPGNLLENMSIERAVRTNVFGADEDMAFRISCGGQNTLRGRRLVAELVRRNDIDVVTRQTFTCPPGGVQQTLFTLKASAAPQGSFPPGPHAVRFYAENGNVRDAVRFDNVWIVDGSPAAMAGAGQLPKSLVREIDCANPATPPDYTNADAQSDPAQLLTTLPGKGRFLQTAPRGWRRTPEKSDDPGFFAYDVTGVEPGRPYLIEFDYPDDAYRTFVVAVFDKTRGYPATGGADSGWDYPASGTIQTGQFLYHARADRFQLAVLNVYGDTAPAAVQKLRVYALPQGLSAFPRPEQGGRRFVNWYEEGASLLSTFRGTAAREPEATADSIRNWVATSAHQGFTTLMPTVSVYGTIYPSEYHDWDTDPWTHDAVKHLLLEAGRHGLEVIPEFHPKAGRLTWWSTRPPAQSDNVLLGKEGRPPANAFDPAHNPLHPESRKWLLGMVREFLQRYKGHGNMVGISLRFMGWADPGLWSFGGSAWRELDAPGKFEDTYGYDDLTMGRFEAETGVRLNIDRNSPQRFRARHDFLMADAQRRRVWYSWKADKVRDIVAQVRQVLDEEAPHLTLYLHYAGLALNSHGLAAGFDARKLGAIPGVRLINGSHRYGRKNSNSVVYQQLGRESLADPGWLRLTDVAGQPSAFLTAANYFECPPQWLPLAELGWPSCPDKKKCPEPTMSAVVNPAGRNALERFAVPLADGDATMLGDGGNTLVWQQQPVRDFLLNYLALPDEPFETVKDADGTERTDPVAVRQLRQGGTTTFYVVNREPYALQARVRFRPQDQGSVRNADDGTVQPLDQDATLAMTLKAYELRTFIATGLRIQNAECSIPNDKRQELEARVAWTEELLHARCPAGARCAGTFPYEAIHRRLKEARSAMAEGRIRAARTAFEFFDISKSLDSLRVDAPFLRTTGGQEGNRP